MENVSFMSRQARKQWKTECVIAARRGNYGNLIVCEVPGAGIMEDVLFLGRQARE